jgi:hypothetical protein
LLLPVFLSLLEIFKLQEITKKQTQNKCKNSKPLHIIPASLLMRKAIFMKEHFNALIFLGNAFIYQSKGQRSFLLYINV